MSTGSKMKNIDYSPEAISRRLRQTEQLRVLSLSLIKAKKAHDEKEGAWEHTVEDEVPHEPQRHGSGHPTRGPKQ